MKQYMNKKVMALLMAAVLAGSTLYSGVADAASAIKLNKKTAKIAVGKSVTLKVRGTKKKVKWKSSKKSVATVNAKGKVTGKKAGKAVVTAKVKGKTLKCKVTVTKKQAAKKNAKTATKKQTAKKTNTAGKKNTTTDISLQKKVISIVNQNRKKQGLEALTMDEKLMKAAQDRAKELTKSFSHTRPNGTSCFTIFEKYKITPMASGENIAAGQRSAAAVMDSWMNSPGHKENIMNNRFKKIGVGLVIVPNDMYSYYWVQMFTE